jgi:hypothetical protein
MSAHQPCKRLEQGVFRSRVFRARDGPCSPLSLFGIVVVVVVVVLWRVFGRRARLGAPRRSSRRSWVGALEPRLILLLPMVGTAWSSGKVGVEMGSHEAPPPPPRSGVETHLDGKSYVVKDGKHWSTANIDEKRQQRKKCLILVGILVVLGGIGGGVAAFASGGGGSGSASNNASSSSSPSSSVQSPPPPAPAPPGTALVQQTIVSASYVASGTVDDYPPARTAAIAGVVAAAAGVSPGAVRCRVSNSATVKTVL